MHETCKIIFGNKSTCQLNIVYVPVAYTLHVLHIEFIGSLKSFKTTCTNACTAQHYTFCLHGLLSLCQDRGLSAPSAPLESCGAVQIIIIINIKLILSWHCHSSEVHVDKFFRHLPDWQVVKNFYSPI
jgi:hypothetical protein